VFFHRPVLAELRIVLYSQCLFWSSTVCWQHGKLSQKNLADVVSRVNTCTRACVYIHTSTNPDIRSTTTVHEAGWEPVTGVDRQHTASLAPIMTSSKLQELR
ncbi:unnamed protein product, partial [Ectocarpus sp. 12 AP-2014]